MIPKLNLSKMSINMSHNSDDGYSQDHPNNPNNK